MAKDLKSEGARILRAEYEWLLTDEFPAMIKQLKSFLQACLQKFSVISSPAHTIKGNNFSLSLPNSDAIKGLINVAGDSVIKAELKLKFPKYAANGIGTFIFEQFPWKLEQLQDTNNHLKMAFDELKEQEFYEQDFNRRRITKLLDQIMTSLSCAKNSLIVPVKYSLSDIMDANAQKVLNPPIPEEILVNFHVNCDKLIFNVFVLNLLTSAPSQKYQFHDSTAAGSVFEHENRLFEVVNRYEIVCTVPWLKDLVIWLNTAQQLCQQMKDKLKIFDTLSPQLHQTH